MNEAQVKTSQRIGKVMSVMRLSITREQAACITKLVSEGVVFDDMPKWIRDSVIEAEKKVAKFG